MLILAADFDAIRIIANLSALSFHQKKLLELLISLGWLVMQGWRLHNIVVIVP
jgi:hypothetical protein